MDHLWRPCMFHVTLLAFILGVSMLGCCHGLDLHHLNRKCHPTKDTRLPSVISVTLNISGQSHHHMGSDVRKRSLSPWDYSYDEEPNRYPHRIAVAKCRHQGCVDTDGNVMNSGNSVEIKQEILVLYREMKDCKPSFRLQKKMITVGCTCVRPIVIHRL
uniref:Uncharacterized protein n=1 Tax=Leptobrachium leishanense TaxID=445787 RepID=A0A8C5MQT6_9ANUR